MIMFGKNRSDYGEKNYIKKIIVYPLLDSSTVHCL